MTSCRTQKTRCSTPLPGPTLKRPKDRQDNTSLLLFSFHTLLTCVACLQVQELSKQMQLTDIRHRETLARLKEQQNTVLARMKTLEDAMHHS